MLARDNPFASHRVLKVRYRLQGVSWDEVLERLARLNYRAAIVGPRGGGKTTLLEDLEPRLKAMGFATKPLRLDAEHPRFERAFEREFFAGLGSRDMLLLDGAEQMPRLAWWRFRRRTRSGGGVIITSHRAGLLPTLLECRTTPELLEGIVRELLGGSDLMPAGEIQNLFDRHRGNLRDALRELYDSWAEGG
jgi:hypothetical protein